MDFTIKRAKYIRDFGISCLVFLLLLIVTTIAVFELTSNIPWTDLTVDTNWILNNTNITFVFIIWVISVIGLTVTGIGCFISCILILATDWKLPMLINDRIVWGIIGLLLIPVIACLVFGSKAYNALLNEKSNKSQTSTESVETNTQVNTETTSEPSKPVNVDDGSW